ncbi:MAG: transcriptional regulator NrdR [Aerococcus sp.]|nr:transcriptional regulator NrdR [Aerococcus sp.]
MQCPNCHEEGTKVIDSRPIEQATAIRRRRSCPHCGFRFTTFERIENQPLLVIKKDGNRQEFSRQKLLRGLVRSAEKRPVAIEQLEELTRDIESELRQSGKREIPSEVIGEMVMARLPEVDEISYIRYASVYRDFKDASVFLKEIEELKKKQQTESAGQTSLHFDDTPEATDED